MIERAIRPERPGDAEAIRSVTEAAFRNAPHAGGTEPEIIDALRRGDMTISLVAEMDRRIVGHAAFSPVCISDGSREWFGLGPVSVLPERQRQGIGTALIRRGLADLAARGGRGVVVLGDPEYYRRFGFEHDPGLTFPGSPARYFQRLVLAGEAPAGTVRYSPAFG